ncbi:MAG: DUF3617 domain-containing protein [Rhizomicrobium sp.]
MLRRGFLAVVALAALAPVAALGGHGKAGLWSSTTTMSMPTMAAQTHSATYCMTPAEVKTDAPPPGNKECSYQNVRLQGHAMSADMVCHGQFEATGHFESDYDSDTHYTAKITIDTGGMKMTNTVEGHWLKADCAGASH